ncbi:MAG: hypothetical protein AAB933_02460 [Patescibacteria group bacterium]
MIGRKLVLLQNGHTAENNNAEEISFSIHHLQKIKHLVVTNTKKWEHIVLVQILRLYVRGISFLKNQYNAAKTKIGNLKMKQHANGEKKEISKFLKIVGDYKNRIRELKHKIKKEENL